MENKRMSNKLNSWFWFILTTLPIIMVLIILIFSIPQYAKNYDWNNNTWIDYILIITRNDIYIRAFNEFNKMSIPFIYDTFSNIFSNTFNINSYQAMAFLFSWMLSVQIYHLIYDVLKFIIEWCHNLIEKAY